MDKSVLYRHYNVLFPYFFKMDLMAFRNCVYIRSRIRQLLVADKSLWTKCRMNKMLQRWTFSSDDVSVDIRNQAKTFGFCRSRELDF